MNSGKSRMEDKMIILFDGVCKLCNRFAVYILQHDPEKKFLLGSLQSDKGKELLNKYYKGKEVPNSVVLIEHGVAYFESTAVLNILSELSGPTRYLDIFKVVPASLRDILYDWIARNRYHWFGRNEECMIPKPEWTDRFLD